jgi:hypothetical protein
MNTVLYCARCMLHNDNSWIYFRNMHFEREIFQLSSLYDCSQLIPTQVGILVVLRE